MQLSSSQAMGTFQTNNPGHVEAFPVWKLYGPGDSFSAVRLSDGRSFEYEWAIPAGEVITIDTRSKRVTDSAGENMYEGLGFAPELFSVPPGQASITAELTNTTSESLVTMDFLPRREFLF